MALQNNWQESLSNATTDPKQLFERLQLDPTLIENGTFEATKDFKLFVTDSYLKKIKPGDLKDPLLLQIMPQAQELVEHIAYRQDPLQENEANPVPGMLHKYHGRALLITTGHCAINCRFCFRRNFPYQDQHLSTENRNAIFSYLGANPDISEVILSGGDPLVLNNKSLEKLFLELEQVKSIKRVRIHTRIPLVLPERVDESLISLLSNTRLKVVMVIHCNHPQELDQSSRKALKILKNICHSLLNQSVLLKNINNNVATLLELQEALFDNGVQSYYLHILDKVKGAAHFDIPLEEAKELYAQLSEKCSGYMLPKLVMEEAGEPNKIQITSVI